MSHVTGQIYRKLLKDTLSATCFSCTFLESFPKSPGRETPWKVHCCNCLIFGILAGLLGESKPGSHREVRSKCWTWRFFGWYFLTRETSISMWAFLMLSRWGISPPQQAYVWDVFGNLWKCSLNLFVATGRGVQTIQPRQDALYKSAVEDKECHSWSKGTKELLLEPHVLNQGSKIQIVWITGCPHLWIKHLTLSNGNEVDHTNSYAV